MKYFKGFGGVAVGFLPALTALIAGGWLIGADVTKIILGWTLVIAGALGLIGLIYSLIRLIVK